MNNKIFLISTLLFVLVSCRTPLSSDVTKKDVAQLFKEIEIAEKNKDIETLSKFYSDDFKITVRYVLNPINKKDFLKLFQSSLEEDNKNEPLKITEIDLKSGKVYVTDGEINYLYHIISINNRIMIKEIQDLD